MLATLEDYLPFRTSHAMNGGIRFPLNHDVLSKKVRRGLRKGTYEIEEAEAAGDLFHDGDTVLELGAGIGFISSYLRKFTNVGRIVAYEGNTNLTPYIKQVHALNGIKGIDVHNAVVLPSPEKEIIPFYVRKEFWSSSLSAEKSGVIDTISVPTKGWSDLIANLSPTALIMDIEGGEVDLLEACDLGPIKRAVIELHPSKSGLSGLAKIHGAITRQGFRIVRESGDRSVISLARQ